MYGIKLVCVLDQQYNAYCINWKYIMFFFIIYIPLVIMFLSIYEELIKIEW